MKQLALFNAPHTKDEHEPRPALRAHWKLAVDGAARNNPGPAGAGIYLTKNDQVVDAIGYFLGPKTNNQAEYLALILGLYHVRAHIAPQDRLLIISDSQLLIRQLEGIYKTRNEQVKKLHTVVRTLLRDIRYDLMHVLRDHNVQADRLANEGIDTKRVVPPSLVQELMLHGIVLYND